MIEQSALIKYRQEKYGLYIFWQIILDICKLVLEAVKAEYTVWKMRICGDKDMAVGIVTGMVLLIVVLKHRARMVLHLLVQMILGGTSIYFINYFLSKNGISTIIALNPLTLLTSGLLGFPGVFLLYAIQFLLYV